MDCRKKAEELFDIILQTGKSLSQIPIGCSQGETGTLLYLTLKENGITASKISEALKVSLPRMASLLNSLEKKELIERVVDSKDKRKTIIYITKKGNDLILQRKKEAINKMTKVLERLSKEEIEQYIELIKKIGNIIVEIQD